MMNGVASKKVENQTMEEILTSIRRIIDDDQRPVPAASEASSMPQEEAPGKDAELEADILALRTALNAIRGEMEDIRSEAAVSFSGDDSTLQESEAEPAEALLSPQAGEAVRQSLDDLTRAAEEARRREFDIEAAAQAMLRPMLSEWLDAHLPPLVERLVQQEIARIVGNRK